MIGGEKDLQPFSAMTRMHVEGKNTEAILPAHMEIVQPCQWEIGDDASVLCPHSVIPVRRFLIRNQNEFTFGYQECAGGSKLPPRPGDLSSDRMTRFTLVHEEDS